MIIRKLQLRSGARYGWVHATENILRTKEEEKSFWHVDTISLLTQFISKFDDAHSFASICVSIVTANFDTLYATNEGKLTQIIILNSGVRKQ